MTLYIVAGLAVLLLAALWYAVRQGRKLERGAAAQAEAEIKDDQLEAATQPRDPTAVIDRLHKAGF